MDRQAQRRDMVYCHECENEWYRDEHGLVCPECQSEFTEIIEAGHDPREDTLEDQTGTTSDRHPLHDHNPWGDADAPDPDEDDISNVTRQTRVPGGVSFSFHRTYTPNGQPHGHADQDRPDPMAGTFQAMLQSIMGGRPPPGWQAPPRPGQNNNTQDSNRGEQGFPRGAHTDGGTYVRQGGGPGFTWRISTQQSSLFPRDANNAQPQGQPFDELPNILESMFGPQRGVQRGQGGDPAFAMSPLGLLSGLFNPANMQSGDAVYSQEALDRIISQLMEQNASGGAPGPATADAIAALPKKTISEEDLGSEGKADCSICMEEVNIGQKVTLLPCHHWFHGECIEAWLVEHDTCPHCRQGIMPKDAPSDANRPRAPNEAPRHDQTWGQGEGTRQNPYNIPDSPTARRPSQGGSGRRHSSTAGPSSRSSGHGGLFDRMRNAFGGGGSSEVD